MAIVIASGRGARTSACIIATACSTSVIPRSRHIINGTSTASAESDHNKHPDRREDRAAIKRPLQARRFRSAARELPAVAQCFDAFEPAERARLLPEQEVNEQPARHVDLEREREQREQQRWNRRRRREAENQRQAAAASKT